MYLAELELQGFKSFAQKTHIAFDSGLTAIVGPNGCGKSNIVDALRWALGEQRPTLLRSAAMANVIFNGTANRKALGMAEVSVTIHNNRGILPTEYRDVTITRRLYRNGDSEYLLNRVPCRLKDIVDLFMDTGMGSNAYSVIELKMVEEILTDKNNDRRRLFEEAAGLTKYKERRKQTHRKLDETRGDLRRVEDLLVEIRKKARSLQIQAGKAQRAKEYGTQLRQLDLALGKHEYESIKGELGPLLERIVHAEQEKADLNRQADLLEAQAAALQETLESREQAVETAQREVNRIFARIKEAETAIRIAEERIASEEHVIRQFEQDVEQSEAELKDWKKRMADAEGAAEAARAEAEARAAALETARAALDAARAESAARRAAVDAAARAHAEATQALQVLQGQRIRLESRLEAAAEEEARLARQRQTQAADAERFEAEAAGLRHQVAQARERRDTAEARRAEAEAARARLGEALEQARNGARDARSKHDALRAETVLLEGLAASADAFPESVRHLRADAAHRAGLLPLSDVFSTDEAHAVALESALGEAVNWLVAPTLAEAEAAFALLKKDGKGKATILPLDRLPASTPSDPRSLVHVVRCAPEHEGLKHLLLGSIWAAEDLESAAALAREHRIVAVTPAGDVVEQGYKFRSGSNHKHTGLRLGLKDKLGKLTAAATQAEAAWKAADADVERLSAELRTVDLAGAQQAARTAEQQLREVENQANALQARKGVYDKTAAETEERLAKAKAQQADLRVLREQLEPEAEDLQDALDLAIRRQVEGRAEAERADENRQRAQSAFNEAQMAAQQAANRLENAQKDRERAETAIAGIRKRLDVRAENAKTSRDRILEAKGDATRNRESLVELREAKQVADAAFREADSLAETHRGRLRQTDTDLRDLRRKKDVHLELLHHLVMAKDRFDLQAKAVADHIWEAYGLTMDRVDEALPPDTDAGTVRETISHLRERLKSIGEVNALAIEEYEQEQERLELMERQVADLVDAEGKLLQTIEEINGTAQELFMSTFEQVRGNFQRVFHTLFDEQDHCDLLLDSDQEDPLERKIQIVANPRGKRPSNIEQLSGGEKTLTAIALLFAIYLVKPSPFCVLDEVDAPLDDANVDRFTSMIRTFSKDTQFIIITHNKKTMEKAEMMYGVTMPEIGVSKLVAVKMD